MGDDFLVVLMTGPGVKLHSIWTLVGSKREQSLAAPYAVRKDGHVCGKEGGHGETSVKSDLAENLTESRHGSSRTGIQPFLLGKSKRSLKQEKQPTFQCVKRDLRFRAREYYLCL